MGNGYLLGKEKLSRIKKEKSSSRILIANFREALSNVVLNLFLSTVHVAPNFLTAINCFYQL